MLKPVITWHIIEEDETMQENEYYLGSYSPNEEIQLSFQVWNNRYGQIEAETIDNARLAIYFETFEDNAILNYCTVSVNEGEFSKPEIDVNKATLYIGELNGTINNGSATDKNRTHFKNVTLKFTNLPSNLKNGLKNLFIDIELD